MQVWSASWCPACDCNLSPPLPAGKSTVAAALARAGWFIVSQDSNLSTDACVAAAVLALRANRSVVVDRCNLTVAQRRVWLALAAAEGAPCDCLHLTTPRIECERRALARKDHRLVPEAALRVIKVLMLGTEPLSPAEGFRSTHDARSDHHIERALLELGLPSEVAAAAVETPGSDGAADPDAGEASAAAPSATASGAGSVSGAGSLAPLVSWLRASFPRDVPLPFLQGEQ